MASRDQLAQALKHRFKAASQTCPAPQLMLAWQGWKLMPFGATVMFEQTWAEFLSNRHSQITVFPHGVSRLLHVVFTPGGTTGGKTTFFFFFLASTAAVPRPSVASAPAAMPLRLRRESRESRPCVQRSKFSASTVTLSTLVRAIHHLADEAESTIRIWLHPRITVWLCINHAHYGERPMACEYGIFRILQPLVARNYVLPTEFSVDPDLVS